MSRDKVHASLTCQVARLTNPVNSQVTRRRQTTSESLATLSRQRYRDSGTVTVPCDDETAGHTVFRAYFAGAAAAALAAAAAAGKRAGKHSADTNSEKSAP